MKKRTWFFLNFFFYRKKIRYKNKDGYLFILSLFIIIIKSVVTSRKKKKKKKVCFFFPFLFFFHLHLFYSFFPPPPLFIFFFFLFECVFLEREIIKNPRFMPPKEKASEGKRKKIVKACKDCRRRKVRFG